MNGADCDVPILRPTRIRVEFATSEAKNLRCKLNLRDPYIDIENVVKSQGIVLRYDFDVEHPTTVLVDAKQYIMFIPPSLHEPVSRWDNCHEFAHIYLGHYRDYPLDRIFRGVYIPLLTDREKYILEREAHIFTTEFLIPKDLVFKLIKYPVTWQSVNHMGCKFGVSSDAVIDKLDQHALLKKSEFKKLGICPSPPQSQKGRIYKGAL